MIRGLQVFALVLAFVAGGTVVRTRRMRHASAATRRSAPGIILVSLAIVVGVAPGLFFTSQIWFRIAASVVSLFISVAAIAAMRRHSVPSESVG